MVSWRLDAWFTILGLVDASINKHKYWHALSITNILACASLAVCETRLRALPLAQDYGTPTSIKFVAGHMYVLLILCFLHFQKTVNMQTVAGLFSQSNDSTAAPSAVFEWQGCDSKLVTWSAKRTVVCCSRYPDVLLIFIINIKTKFLQQTACFQHRKCQLTRHWCYFFRTRAMCPWRCTTYSGEKLS